MSKTKRRLTCLTLILCLALSACSQPFDRAPIEGPSDVPGPNDIPNVDVYSPPRLVGQNDQVKPVVIGGQRYTPKEDLLNVLLIGVDNDSTRNEVGRADMIVLCALDAKEGTISLLTVPRDTHAWVHHVSDDGEIEDSVYEKINHAYMYGRGATKYSAENTMACTSRLLECDGQLEVPIHYYLSMDLDGLADLADIFGGVDVTLDQDMPNIGAAGQTVKLQGPYVRYYLEMRHGMNEGEVSRQIHQQIFLKSLMQAIKDQGGSKAAATLYTMFVRFMRTNLSPEQFIGCISLLDNLQIEDISMTRITGEGVMEDGIWYLQPDPVQMRDLVLASQYDAS